jgi:hypothetical protein
MSNDIEVLKLRCSAQEKHLEMIQKVIERLAAQAGQMKRLSLATAAAAIGGIKLLPATNLGWAAVVVLSVFWILESKYLQQERWFRDLFDQVRARPMHDRTNFNMRPESSIRAQSPLIGAILSWSTAGMYFPIIIVIAFFAGN